MQSQLFKFLLIAFLVFAAAMTNAAEIVFEGGIDSSCDKLKSETICLTLTISGKIEKGDLQKLQRELESKESTFNQRTGMKMRISKVFLDSPGGSVSAAMDLGRFIRTKQISTQIAKGDICASSCVLILAGGVSRVPAGRVIVHSFYSPEILGTNDFVKAEATYTKVAEQVGTYLKEMRISNQLLEEMMRVPHSSSRDLTIDQMLQWGLIGIDPVYAQARKIQ